MTGPASSLCCQDVSDFGMAAAPDSRRLVAFRPLASAPRLPVAAAFNMRRVAGRRGEFRPVTLIFRRGVSGILRC